MTLDYERWAELSDREESGEELSAPEKEFLRMFAETDDAARAEVELFAQMSDLGVSEDAAAEKAVAERAVAAVSESRRSSRSRRTVIWGAFGSLAAAAAVAFFVHGQKAETASASIVEFASAEAFVDGVRVEKGARVPSGSEILAGSQPVCVAVEPRIHACIASGGKLRLSQTFTAERRVEVLAGRAAFALDPLPKGEHFAVKAAGVTSTAVGTAFTVELGSVADGIRTVVHEGKVRVDGPSGASALVTAHKIGLAKADTVSVDAVSDHHATETPEWTTLASVAGRAIEGEGLVVSVPEVPEAPAVEALQPSAPETAVPASAERPQARGTKTTPEPVVSAGDLLSEARQALRDQRWTDAASSYQKLVATYPSTPEARTAVVPLAKLQVDRLGQPAAALPGLESYIHGGGTLVVEARLARIRALRALGRSAEEARAIEEFLSAHPASLEAENLRARLAAIRGE